MYLKFPFIHTISVLSEDKNQRVCCQVNEKRYQIKSTLKVNQGIHICNLSFERKRSSAARFF